MIILIFILFLRGLIFLGLSIAAILVKLLREILKEREEE